MSTEREDQIRRIQHKVKMDMLELARLLELREWGAVCITVYALMESMIYGAVLRKCPDTSTRVLRDLCFGNHRTAQAAFNLGILSRDTRKAIKNCNRQRKYIHGNSYMGIFSYTERMARQAVEALGKIARDVDRCDYTPCDPCRARGSNRQPPQQCVRRGSKKAGGPYPPGVARKVLLQFLGLAYSGPVPRMLTVRYS